ncbi:MAG: hypothetical protein ABSF03_02015 [Streptosporangiaceae bacterium]
MSWSTCSRNTRAAGSSNRLGAATRRLLARSRSSLGAPDAESSLAITAW